MGSILLFDYLINLSMTCLVESGWIYPCCWHESLVDDLIASNALEVF